MKVFFRLLGMVLVALPVSYSAYAELVVKECKISTPASEGSRSGLYQVFRKDGKLQASITESYNGYSVTYPEDKVEIQELPVAEGLTLEADLDSLNEAELQIVHAMHLMDPEYEGRFNVGFDLSKVRSATLYKMGEESNGITMTIVEAHDENRLLLGSFFSNLHIFACQ